MLVFLLPALSAGWKTGLHSDQASLMRQEKQAQLSAGGEVSMVHSIGNQKKVEIQDICNYNFTAGAASQSKCTDPATQHQIEEEILCRGAAELACPDDGSCMREDFMLRPPQFNDFPLHCFKGEDGKYGYNPGPLEPTAAKGVPICYQTQFINGTAESNDCGNAAYSNVILQDDCRTIVTCLSECDHAMFQIVNASDEEKHPIGCFRSADGCLYFNNKTEGTPAGPISGVPLCRRSVA